MDVWGIIEISTLAAIIMQFPILVLLIVFSRQAYTHLKIIEFKLIYIAWIVNFFYLMITVLIYYFEFMLNRKVCIYSSIFEISFGFLYVFIFFVAIRKRSHSFTWLKIGWFKWYGWFNTRIKLFSFFFCFFFLANIRQIYFFRKKGVDFLRFVTQIPITVFYVSVLVALALYFRELDKMYKRKISYLSIGIFVYAFIQFLTLFERITSFANLNLMGFTLGLISTSFITYGLHRMFVFHAEKNIEKEVIASKLDQILGRTFHELSRPLINLERDISKLLDENNYSIVFNHEARSLIELIEINHSKVHANLNAQKKLYNWGIHKGRIIVETQEVSYGNQIQSTSINTLLEISRLTTKNIAEKVEIISEYSSHCNMSCNPNEILQIFDNLLKNSCDSFPDGIGKIFIKTTFESSEKFHGKVIKVDIADNGEGISKNIAHKVFEERISTREGLGRGLGLAIVKDLVSKYKGEIYLESPYQSNKFKKNLGGTKMTIIFPKKEQESR
jgi:signal transduction histidine kinase